MRRLPIPHPAVLLLAAAIASDLFPGLELSIHTVERVATVALVVILFDGGASIGLTRFRAAVVPIASLGIAGTFATAGIMTLFLHVALALDWLTAGLLAAAVAPTDPAVMFSVLGQREIEGRTDTVLEGESGANDPVGIALMLGLIELATHSDASFWVVVRVFSEQMAVGLVVGVAGGLLEARLLPRVARFSFLMTLGLAAIVFAAADVAHGSGFLAVFVAGLIRGDVEAPRHEELERLRERLASVAEVVVFVALGLTVDLSGIGLGRWGEGLLVAAFLAIVARPLVCAHAARARSAANSREALRRLGWLEGRSADPARRVCARPPRGRRTADLRDRLRRRARFGRRPGEHDPVRRPAARSRIV